MIFESTKIGRGNKADRNVREKGLALSRAELCLKIGQIDRCLVDTRAILADDPNHVGALEVLAKALWQAGDCETLLTTLDRLILLNPYEPGYHALRGAAYQSLGRLGDAVNSFSRAKGNEEALAELQEWQAELVANLIYEDRVFRAQYAQDPKAACLARGFAFTESPAQAKWLSERRETTALYTRPS